MNEVRLGRLTDWLAAAPSERALAVRACLERIRALDPQLHAWVQVTDPQAVSAGSLCGIPFGVKDTVETRGLRTEYGSAIYRGRMGTADGAIVRMLRDAGAILLGKTVTTPFAYRTPAGTRNPRNPSHTPGGSSSGSAAAVAADMVPFTVGEQTLGSILRPASYCGVTGFKPSYGLLSTEGMLPLAPSLDTLGFFTQTPADMLALWSALGQGAGRTGELIVGVPDFAVEPPMRAAFQHVLTMLREAGIEARTVDLAPLLTQVAAAAHTVLCYEAAEVHRRHLLEHEEELGTLGEVVRAGMQTDPESYHAALQSLESYRGQAAEVFEATPLVFTPAATGPAPAGLGSTGDPRMNAPWTALGTPAVSIPMPVANALPLGLQITAAFGQDARLLRAAVQVASILEAAPRA
jgi:Asp-tRNA(Asn)/Glu-tRNA(Gln) amidotransferase A subunit family amidase